MALFDLPTKQMNSARICPALTAAQALLPAEPVPVLVGLTLRVIQALGTGYSVQGLASRQSALSPLLQARIAFRFRQVALT